MRLWVMILATKLEFEQRGKDCTVYTVYRRRTQLSKLTILAFWPQAQIPSLRPRCLASGPNAEPHAKTPAVKYRISFLFRSVCVKDIDRNGEDFEGYRQSRGRCPENHNSNTNVKLKLFVAI